MFDLIASGNAPLTMTSREIAELTGKRHDHVLSDIRKMLDELGLSSPDFSGEYKDSTGRTLPCFNLPHRECMILVSGYSIPMRARIVDRWEALEAGKAAPAAAPQMKHSYADAMAGLDIVCRSMNLEGSAKLGMFRKGTEVTAPHLLPALPVYAIDAPSGSGAGSSEATASLTQLLKEAGIKASAVAVNAKLEGEGILERKTRPSRSSGGEKAFWSITDAGLKYGKNLVSPSNARETQPHWYRSRFNGLMARIGVN